ncbi:MAG: DUF2007 domain-containing protein [Kofleriaceae bacterium]
MSRVRIGVCTGAADAALVRSVLSAHEIEVVIGAENHASMLGGLGDGFLTLDISVDERDAEAATTLLGEIRNSPVASDPDEDVEGDAVWVEQRVERKRRTGVALLLACCVTFGTAHMYTGAWLRGIVLAGLELIGIRYAGPKPVIGAVLIAAAIVCDLVGAMLRVQTTRSNLPPARVQSQR